MSDPTHLAAANGVVAHMKSLARDATIEVIPLRGALEKIASIPESITVTVTCSPKFGFERTLEQVTHARELGHRVVPHLAARSMGSKHELRAIVLRLGDLGVDDLYVVGGDGDAVGPYSEAFDVLRDIQDMEHRFVRLGVGCYPEGHPHIAPDVLIDALMRKQQYATYMVNQLCFDGAALLDWIRSARQSGINIPLRIGLTAPLRIRKLVEMAVKIGVGPSVKFLTKQHGLVGGLLGGSYEPADLLIDVLTAADVDELKIEGLHLFSFNQVDLTLGWLNRLR
jgi:methylenetetrahydrofolate reductase (NADPH)